MRNILAVISIIVLAISCNTDDIIVHVNPLEGKIKHYVILEEPDDSTTSFDTVKFEYDTTSGVLLRTTSNTSFSNRYSIEVISPTELRIESNTWGDYRVTIQGLQVTRIECLAGPTTHDYCDSGVYDWELTFDGDGQPDSVLIDLEYDDDFLFGDHYITRGKLTEFEFNENYTSSTYRYFNHSASKSKDFEMTASDKLFTSFIPHQNPYLDFLLAPEAGIVKAEGPSFILGAAGYKILRRNKHLVGSINDTEFEYVVNSDGQVSEMLIRRPTHDRQFLFTYYQN